MAESINRPKMMGPWMATALVMGGMIGSGVFLLPTSLAPLGWNAVLGWVITIAGMLCIAYVIARLATALPLTGGPYAYARNAFGNGTGFIVAWSYWIATWVSVAALSTAAVSYLSRLVPIVGTPEVSIWVSIGFVWLFTLINLRGARVAGGVQVMTTVIKVIPLLAVIVLALWAFAGGGTTPPTILAYHSTDLTLPAISLAVASTMFAMLGVEAATVPAGSVRDPQRTIPRATLVGAGATGLIYIFVCSAIILMLPTAVVATSEAPFADFVDRFAGSDAGVLITAVGAISALGALNGWTLVQAELPAVLASDGFLPKFLAKRSARGVPVVSTLMTSSLVSIVLILNDSRSMADMFQFLILLTTSASIYAYVVCLAAAARMSALGTLPKSAVLMMLVAAGGAYLLLAMIGVGWEANGWGLVLLGIGLPIYWLSRRVSA